jgi:hypothetical protein
MAGLEVLGAAASAAQLADYGRGIVIFLTEVYKRVKNAPKQYREYETQLHLLIRNAEHIANSPAFRASDVKLDLDSIEVEVRALQAILCHPAAGPSTSSNPRNLWTLIKGVEQKEIEECLDRLHRKNSALSFYILTVSAGKVHLNVEKLIETMPVREHSPAESVKERCVSQSNAPEFATTFADLRADSSLKTTPQTNRRPWENRDLTPPLEEDNQLVPYERTNPLQPKKIEDSDTIYDTYESKSSYLRRAQVTAFIVSDSFIQWQTFNEAFTN